jgi:hypothetical protein
LLLLLYNFKLLIQTMMHSSILTSVSNGGN